MEIKSCLLLLLCFALANAAKWTFNVVTIYDRGLYLGLSYNNKIIQLNSTQFPLFTGTIESAETTKYKYVLIDSENNEVVEEEYFERTFDTSRDSTLNEVYERKRVVHNITELPKVYDPIFKSGTEKFKDLPNNEILTVYATCDEATYTNLKYNPFVNGLKNEEKSSCNITIITSDAIYTKPSELSLVGFNSRTYQKLSWKFKFDKKILGRKTLKLRGIPSDPSLIRDKLTNSLVKAVGIPVQSHTYARLYINDETWGIYGLIDTISSKWLASAIHADDDHEIGYTYKMYSSVPNGPFASLRYLGEDELTYLESGSYECDEINELDLEAANNFTRLAEFTKKLENWVKDYENDQSEKCVTALNEFFYLESLLRQMVIESLTFAYDNFWAQLGNFALYRNPDDNKYVILPYDFDGTFSGTMGSEYFKADAIQDCITWANSTPTDKYFVNALFSHQIIVDRYNVIMKDVLDKLFRIDVLSPYIDSIVNMISPDVEWSFDSLHYIDSKVPGFINRWTYEDFKNNSNYLPIDYKPEINYNDSHYGVKQWIELRAGYCNAYINKLNIISGSNNGMGNAPSTTPTTTTTFASTPSKTTTSTITTTRKRTTTKRITTTKRKTTTFTTKVVTTTITTTIKPTTKPTTTSINNTTPTPNVTFVKYATKTIFTFTKKAQNN